MAAMTSFHTEQCCHLVSDTQRLHHSLHAHCPASAQCLCSTLCQFLSTNSSLLLRMQSAPPPIQFDLQI